MPKAVAEPRLLTGLFVLKNVQDFEKVAKRAILQMAKCSKMAYLDARRQKHRENESRATLELSFLKKGSIKRLLFEK